MAERRSAEGELARRDAAEAWRNVGALAFLHDSDKALAAYEKAVAAWPDDIDAWNQLGRLFHRAGELERAESAYRQFESLAAAQSNVQMYRAIAYGNLGNVYQTRGELDRAVEIFEKSLAIDKALGHQEGMAIQYGNLGIVHEIRGEVDHARRSWTTSVQLFREIGSPTEDQVQHWLDALK